jgi:hypothetical protein
LENGTTKDSVSVTYWFKADIPTPKVTQGIIDSGFVFYYFKDSTGPYAGKVYPLWGTDVGNTYGAGATIRNQEEIYYSLWNDDYNVSKDKFTIYTDWTHYPQYSDPNSLFYSSSVISLTDYGTAPVKPKTRFYIRYVVIPGGIANGRTTGIDMKNYEQVKKQYNITD